MLQLNYCEYLCPFTENTGDGYPLKQELHKCLPGTFQKVLTDKHAASVRHAEGGAFQILRVFQIHDYAAPAHKKACVIL